MAAQYASAAAAPPYLGWEVSPHTAAPPDLWNMELPSRPSWQPVQNNVPYIFSCNDLPYCIVVRKDVRNDFTFLEFTKPRFMAQDVYFLAEKFNIILQILLCSVFCICVEVKPTFNKEVKYYFHLTQIHRSTGFSFELCEVQDKKLVMVWFFLSIKTDSCNFYKNINTDKPTTIKRPLLWASNKVTCSSFFTWNMLSLSWKWIITFSNSKYVIRKICVCVRRYV